MKGKGLNIFLILIGIAICTHANRTTIEKWWIIKFDSYSAMALRDTK